MITVTIDSVDKTSDVVFNSLKITDNINQKNNNLVFKIRKYGSNSYVPSIGDEVVVDKSGTTIFGGVIIKIKENIEASKLLEYEIVCNDYSQYLKRQLVTERYTTQNSYEIIDDIVTNYTSGFTINNVATSQDLSISFNRLTVAQCLEKLAETLNYIWYVDYNQDIHFIAKNTELAPFDLTDSSNNYIYNSLEIQEDITQLKNSLLVEGGTQVSDSDTTEHLSGDGTKTIFALASKFQQAVKPSVSVNSVAQTVGRENVDGGGFDVYWNYNEKALKFISAPASGTANIEVVGKIEYPVVVKVPNNSSINTYGLYEYAITDKTITSQDQAIERALAELRTYANVINEGQFKTYNDGLRTGQVLNINSTQRNKNIDVVIQSIDTRMRDPEGNNFEYTVKFATLKTIGIIDYLQKQLRDKEIIEDDLESLLNYYEFDDEISVDDSIGTPTTTTGPYYWADATGGNTEAVWNFSTWT